MPNISLSRLTVKQREAWKMRYRYRWRLKKIAAELGISIVAVKQLIRRAHKSAGVPFVNYLPLKGPDAAKLGAMSFSDCLNYY